MKTKEEYIAEEVEKIQDHKLRRKESYLSFVDFCDSEIGKMKNLSDEDYAEIVKNKIEEDIEENELETILAKVGVTLEQFDNTPIYQMNNTMSNILSGLSPKDKIRLVELLS